MAEDFIGQQFGPFHITEWLGGSDLFDVYMGRDLDSGLSVQIKIISREHEDDPVFDTRFRREARAIVALSHPNIAQVLDLGETERGHYVVSRHVEGMTLAALLDAVRADGQPLQGSDVTFLVRQMAAALAEAHRHGIVHRALTPERIIVTRSGQAILTDFGLALLASPAHEGAGPGAVLGPPEYMAPEVHADARAAAAASDIYSLGAITYELLTLERPFRFESDIDVALRDLADTAPDPRLLRPDIPTPAAQAILRALATSPRERFDDAMAFAAALEAGFGPGAAVAAAPAGGSLEQGADAPRPDAAASAPAAEQLHVKRGLTKREARREKQRLRREHQKLMQAERERVRAGRRLPLTLSRVVVALVVVLLLGGAAAFLLQALGITSLPLGPAFARPETEMAEAQPSATPPASPEAEAAPPTETAVPSATPLATVAATPIPSAAATTLPPGASAYRLIDGAVLRFVPRGAFLMGTNDPSRRADARPQHTVMLSDYWLDATEVTNARYALCVEAGACSPPVSRRFFDSSLYANQPVTFVQHTQAVSYCLWLARETGEPLGLPTEAQWEKAAAWDPETGEPRRYPWGNEPPSAERLRFAGSGPGGAAPVGAYPAGASAYGVLDLAGNVWEWVADWYAEDTYAQSGLRVDPSGPASGQRRVTRGGGWLDDAPLLASSVRNWASPTAAGDDLGFRCALNAAQPGTGSIYLAPADLARDLAIMLADARSDRTSDAGVLEDWQTALEQLEQALASGDDATARAIVRDRLVQVTKQRNNGELAPDLALRLESAMLWVQGQLGDAD